jgi:hypothetical protein
MRRTEEVPAKESINVGVAIPEGGVKDLEIS